MPAPRLLVFDLDGTLIDSERDLAGSVNATLAAFSRPLLPLSAIRSYIGDGASMLVRRALGLGESAREEDPSLAPALAFFLNHYRRHKLDHTRCYPGVIEALTTLRLHMPELILAVLTNKPVNASREICAGLDLSPFFFRIYGGNSFPQKKPDPHGLLTLIAEATFDLRRTNPAAAPVLPAETIMIGDSPVDIATADAAGTLSIGCTFGLSPGSLAQAKLTALAHSPLDWPDLVAALGQPPMLC